MQLYNTLTKKIEELTGENNQLGMYACGFTVYDYAHLGHLRHYLMDDILVRSLRNQGIEVNFVQNITDVGHLSSDADTGEDKLEKGAKKYQTSVWEVAKKFEKSFFDSLEQMNILRPDVSCRATDHIDEQLEMVKTLEKKGFTYVIEGDGVYFDTSLIDDYGKLAGLKLEAQQAGARVELVKGKRHPSDFALWKFEREGENRAMVWPSPWHERSFPGWHVECSAMSIKYLGEQFDLHTGGIDHIPVHHTNEIAQSEAATGKKPFVRHWVHHNFLLIDGQKMSKSLGNFFTIDDVIARGFSPMALRLLFLTAHYRSEMNFTWENLAGAEKSYRQLLAKMTEWMREPGAELGADANHFLAKFWANLNHDLNTPEAVATMWQVVKSDLPIGQKREVLLEMDQILGLELDKNINLTAELMIDDLPDEAKALVQQRQRARLDQNWPLADKLRKEIEAAGFILTDLPDNQLKISDKV